MVRGVGVGRGDGPLPAAGVRDGVNGTVGGRKELDEIVVLGVGVIIVLGVRGRLSAVAGYLGECRR